MNISPRGLALVKSFEGCLKPIGGGKFKPYICPAGVLTIGWGHTNHHGRKFTKDSVWTQAECDAALAEDMRGFEVAVSRLVTVLLTQSQFDALVSFTYNCGEGNLAKSTLLRRVNGGDFDGAADEFAKWNRGGGKVLNGLTRRRAAEAALFRSEPVAPSTTEPMPQQVDPPPGEGGPFQPPVIIPPSSPSQPVPAPVALPWYKRAWAKFSAVATSLFGGGLYFGGFKVTPELILSLCLLLVIAGIGLGIYFIGKNKKWWG